MRKTTEVGARCIPKVVVGARLGAEHQPQRVASTRAAEIFPALDVTRRLRLVCDTAALRTAGQAPNNFGMHRATSAPRSCLLSEVISLAPGFSRVSATGKHF